MFFVSLLKILIKVWNKTKESSHLAQGGCSLLKELSLKMIFQIMTSCIHMYDF